MAAHMLLSNILTAFNKTTIGTKITDIDGFMPVAMKAIGKHLFDQDRVPGQGIILCPEAAPFVSAGVGKRTKDPNDYVLREYRGNVEAYLKREKAAAVEDVALIVYTREAYLTDPDVMNDAEEKARVEATNATHVLVAVLAFAGPKAPLSPHRLVHNLAGGNNEALTWSADEIRAKALESKTYHDEWCTVAD